MNGMRKNDFSFVIMLLVSWVLQKTLTEEDESGGSELLPNNWNDNDDNYALRYTHNKQLYILLALRTEGSLIITLLDVKTLKVSNIGLHTDELVKTTKGSLKTMIPTASELADRYRKELLEPVNKQTAIYMEYILGNVFHILGFCWYQ